MKKALAVSAAVKLLAGLFILGALLFGCAGTFAYLHAWLFLLLLFVPMAALGTALLLRAPHLLEKRLRHREQGKTQSRIVALSGLLFISVFALCGLDFRFGWSRMPRGLTILSALVQLSAYALYAEVMRENAFLSRTVEIQQGQHVVSTGLYGLVRHPMYTSTVLLFLAMPLVLGSFVAFAVMLLYPVCIAARIRAEEAFLLENLEGYEAYMQSVRWRLIPFVW